MMISPLAQMRDLLTLSPSLMSSPHRGNPNKRQRTEEADEKHPAGQEPSTRDEKHWYSDGSLVLRVEGALFRVHKTVRSPVAFIALILTRDGSCSFWPQTRRSSEIC